MKKILGISLVALFAAVPMMAGAANLPEVTIVAADAQNNEKGDANKMATVSYVKGAYGAIRTAVNSKAEQSDMTAVQSAIETLNGNAQTAGSVDKKIADAITSSLTSESTNGQAASAKATYDAIQAAITSATYDDTEIQQAITSAQGDIETLQNAGYITKDVNNLTNYTTTTDMNSAISDAIDSALDDYTTTTGLQNTYATKAGVTATITASTITATVPALADWNSSTVTNVAVTAGIAGAEYTAE